jgi:hypothetical protein
MHAAMAGRVAAYLSASLACPGPGRPWLCLRRKSRVVAILALALIALLHHFITSPRPPPPPAANERQGSPLNDARAAAPQAAECMGKYK